MTSKKNIYDMLEITTIDFDWILENLRDLDYDKTWKHISDLKQRIYRLQLTVGSDIERTNRNNKFRRDWKRAEKIAGNLNLDYFNLTKFIIRRNDNIVQKIKDNHNI